MSDPKRYLCGGYVGLMHEFEHGDWIAYADYARLKADVERLTKAGDGVFQDFMEYVEYGPSESRFLECRADWNAAKEGKNK